MSAFTPPEWKHLAMRTVISETLGAAADRATGKRDVEFWGAVREIADFVINRRAARQRKRPVHQYIADGLSVLRSAFRRQLSPSVEQSRALEAQLANALTLNDSRRCPHCAERVDVCSEMWVQKPPPVSFAGICIGDFRDHFWLWDSVTRRFYEFEQRAACPLDVRIGFRKSARAKPHGLTIDMAISGECEFSDLSGSRRSLITIDVAIPDFNWASVAAVPYLLMHELVCHAYQGCWASGPRQLPEEPSAFADGWLDGVAFRLLEAAVLETCTELARLPWSDDPTLKSWLWHGGRLHRARYEEGVERHQYKSGLLCGLGVVEFLQRVRRSMPNEILASCDANWPGKTAADIAKTLNAIRTSSSPEFDATILRLSTVLSAEGQLCERGHDTNGIRVALWEALQQFLLAPDLDALVMAMAEPRIEIYLAQKELRRRDA